MNIKDRKILFLSMVSSAVVSSLITYFAMKTNYQEQYYAQMLEQQKHNKVVQEQLGTYIKPNYGNSKSY